MDDDTYPDYIDWTRLVPAARAVGSDEEETEWYRFSLQAATRFVRRQLWYLRITKEYLGFGIKGILGIFLFKVDSTDGALEPWIWVIVGDIPPLDLPGSCARNAFQALNIYMGNVKAWIDMHSGRTVDGHVPAFELQPTTKTLNELQGKLALLDRTILNDYADLL